MIAQDHRELILERKRNKGHGQKNLSATRKYTTETSSGDIL